MANHKDINSLSINKDARAMIARAREEGIETVWDRLAAQQPQCGYCAMGVSCRNCAMGPCRVDPFGEGPQKGVCGADADIIVARNLGRTIAAGAAAHSDHGRDILEVFAELAEGKTSGYEIRDPDKLRALAEEWGLGTEGRETFEIAQDLASAMMEDFGTRKSSLGFATWALRPAYRARGPSAGRSSASRPAASIARTWKCFIAPTWAWITTM
jgi:carbon-monoxide dehydrogenase catalytic subunit